MAGGELRGLRILIVEDESLILLTIQDIVEELGCEVVGTAMRAERAIAILRSQAVDAALLDVNLGDGRTSYPVADALTARGIPFAFVTGYGSGGVRSEYQGCPILSKPVDQADLEAALRKMAPAAPLQ
jgi:CheY-like chemotaxis protein